MLKFGGPDADTGRVNGVQRWAARAVAATAVLLVVLAGAVVVDREDALRSVTVSAAGGAQIVLAEQPPAPTVVPTTTSPRPTTTVPRPSSTTTAKAPAPSAQPARTDFGPRLPGSVNLPYQQGQTVWSATSNGIAMTLRTDTVNPVAGTPVHFVLEGSPPTGTPCCFLQLSAGDAPPFSTQTSKTDPAGCARPTTGPQRAEANVTFNRGGRFEFLFQVASLCVNPDVSGVVYGFVDVGAGPSSAQGPSLPRLNADDGRRPDQMRDPSLAVAWAQASDEDGYIAGFSVDWGDGTAPQTFPGDPLGCKQGRSGWPNSSGAWISGPPTAPPPSHRYAVPKPYVITVSVWSTGCDGSQVQRVSALFPWIPPTP